MQSSGLKSLDHDELTRLKCENQRCVIGLDPDTVNSLYKCSWIIRDPSLSVGVFTN